RGRGRSPRARERAKGARPAPGCQKAFCKPRMRLASEKFFRFLFFKKGTKERNKKKKQKKRPQQWLQKHNESGKIKTSSTNAAAAGSKLREIGENENRTLVYRHEMRYTYNSRPGVSGFVPCKAAEGRPIPHRDGPACAGPVRSGGVYRNELEQEKADC
ncbi:MAG: hypothetical protein ACI4LE_03080, partial [Faecalibacterium sp.]